MDPMKSTAARYPLSKIPKHYVQDDHGNWSHPSRVRVSRLDPGVGSQPAGPQHSQVEAGKGGQGRSRRGAGPGRKARVAQPRRRGSQGPGRARIAITLIVIRSRLLDDDNSIVGCKSLRDAVAEWIGLDDGDPALMWSYQQVVGRQPGTIVLIQEAT